MLNVVQYGPIGVRREGPMRTATVTGTTEGGDPRISFGDVVRLYDTDASGLIYFGAATRWATEATFELMAAIGRTVEFDGGWVTPVRAANFEYLTRLAMGDDITVSAWFARVGRTSFEIEIDVARDGATCVRARMTHVHVNLADGRTGPVPAEIAALAVARG